MRQALCRLMFAALVLSLLSCGHRGVAPDPSEDPFSRTYPVEFKTFHPLVNSALQEFAREQKGSSFQISRLADDGVVMRGLYHRNRDGINFRVHLRIVPVATARTRVQIQISSNHPETSAESLALAAGELFRVIDDRNVGLLVKP